jgi:hypothetical protein
MTFSAWPFQTYRQDGATTNATPLSLLTIALPTAGNASIDVFVVARDSGGNSKSFKFSVGAKSVGGVATVLGAVASLLAVGDAGAAAWTATAVASSGNIVIQVTGALATNIDWSAYVSAYTPS